VKRVTLSRAAEADLEAIDAYTIEQFGLRQAIKTAAAFKAAMVALADNPRSGRLDEERSPPGRPFRFRPVLGAFVIVYEPWEKGIRVARVLHGARHLQAELERRPGDQ
jgi:plasmid stabilization system protein ParE